SSNVSTCGVSQEAISLSYPLSFSQVAHWNSYRLDQSQSACIISAATRILGPLVEKILWKSLSTVINRHDALRTRITVRNGTPIQELPRATDFHVEVEDFSWAPESARAAEIARLVENTSKVDIIRDPLLAVRLIKFDTTDHALLVNMEHIISDGRSMALFHDELFATYRNIAGGLGSLLQPVSAQFTTYALAQRNAWLSKAPDFSAYVTRHFSGCNRIAF